MINKITIITTLIILATLYFINVTEETNIKTEIPNNVISVGYKIKNTKYNDNATTIELEFDGKTL